MDILIMTSQIILALAILVTLHELGHFAAARMFGIKVEKFYLFFDAWGFKLFKFKKGDTEYGIGWLPLGGYVKIAGMIDESMDTEAMKKDPEPWEFRSKPAWQRLIVMLGGVTVNFVLGILIYIFSTWYYGDQRLPIEKVKYGIHAMEVGESFGLKDGDNITGVNGQNVKYFEELKKSSVIMNTGSYYDVNRNGASLKVKLPADIIDKVSDKKSAMFDLAYPCYVDSVLPKSGAAAAGLQKGDHIIALNDTATVYYHEFTSRMVNYMGKSIKIKLLRNGDTLIKSVDADANGKLGFNAQNVYAKDYDVLNYNFGQSIGVGTTKSFEALSDNIKGLKKLITGKIDPRKSMQGPIGIAQMFGSEWIWERFWLLTGILSLILAFMNLLPIPALDGGHVVFLIIEMVIKRPLSDKFMQIMQTIGMVILLALMVFVFGNDIYKIIFK
ncbi:MAG: RIP metalloprotease RseP [bacterium]|nr:RIP metalloprotease RseP [bacterium]